MKKRFIRIEYERRAKFDVILEIGKGISETDARNIRKCDGGCYDDCDSEYDLITYYEGSPEFDPVIEEVYISFPNYKI
jgi:hypothetical protein